MGAKGIPGNGYINYTHQQRELLRFAKEMTVEYYYAKYRNSFGSSCFRQASRTLRMMILH